MKSFTAETTVGGFIFGEEFFHGNNWIGIIKMTRLSVVENSLGNSAAFLQNSLNSNLENQISLESLRLSYYPFKAFLDFIMR